jgi:hypothetical protein
MWLLWVPAFRSRTTSTLYRCVCSGFYIRRDETTAQTYHSASRSYKVPCNALTVHIGTSYEFISAKYILCETFMKLSVCELLLHHRMVGWLIKWQTGTDLKERHFLGAAEENHKYLNWVIRCCGRDSERTPTVTPTIPYSVYVLHWTYCLYRHVARRRLCKQRTFLATFR